MARQNWSSRGGSSNRQWNAYSPPNADNGPATGSRGQPSFFYYNPDGSSQSQWWYNTFAEGQELPPPVEYNNPYAHTPSGYYPSYNYTPESAAFDQKYRQYRPNRRSLSPHHQHHGPPPPPLSRTMSPLPQLPSSGYLAVAEQPSYQLSDPSCSRKLLVLDLNGTLLHRSAHSPRSKSRFKRNGGGDGVQIQPRSRAVHQRPYMPSFRSFVFHPQTKEWLDVMIWSSAQPHNVADMVDKCFGEQKNELVAVWGRDMLGLSDANYKRKVQTTKDLNTPWMRLFSFATLHDHHDQQSQQQEQNGDTSPAEHHMESFHSPMTTILMDDSAHKAELQPYNHLCIKEYGPDTRAKDLYMLQLEKQKGAFEQTTENQVYHRHSSSTAGHTALSSMPSVAMNLAAVHQSAFEEQQQHGMPFEHDGSMGIQPDATLLQSSLLSPSMSFSHDDIPSLAFSDSSKQHEQQQQQQHQPSSASKKRKRKDKKKGQLETTTTGSLAATSDINAAATAAAVSAALAAVTGGAEIREIKFDETLLAIVGILDEMKMQSNVSYWIKSGGLWGPTPPSLPLPRQAPAQMQPTQPPPSFVIIPNGYDSDLSLEDDTDGREKNRQRREAIAVINELLPILRPTGNDGSASASSDGVGIVSSGGSVSHVEGNDHRVAHSDTQTSRVASDSLAESFSPSGGDGGESGESVGALMWFDHPPTMSYWIVRGRKALESLGIPIVHGIDR